MENGVDLRECIVKLYKEYYHGGLMKLVVIGGGIFFRFMMRLALILGKTLIKLIIMAFVVI